MRRRPLAAAAAALVLTAGAAAGCGGSSATVTKTVTTDSLPATTTAPASTTPGVTAPTGTLPAQLGEEQLPPQDAVPGLQAASSRAIADPAAFVDALYRDGDPAKPAAVTRLEGGGYVTGVLRDQVGTDPATQIALFRSYAILLRDDAAARDEVAAGVQEVRDSTTAATSPIDLPDIPGAQGLRVEVDEGGVKGAVAFVTFPAGSYVYGLQGISTDDAALPQDEIVGAARDLYEKVTAAP